MKRLVGFVLVVASVLTGCDLGAGRSTTAEGSFPDPAVTLRHLPDGTGCDLVGNDFRSITFHVGVIEPVWAESDRGRFLHTHWSSSYSGGNGDDLVVRDRNGLVVARDGDVLTIPDGGWPAFHGYFVCPQPNAVYFFDHPAS